MSLEFKEFSKSDLSFTDKWLKQPHVKEFWGVSNFDESYEEYVLRTSTDSSVHQFTIQHKDQPIGYIQYYWASKVGDGWWEGFPDYTIGFDFYIGEPKLLGKGLGKKVIVEFCSYIFNTTNALEIIGDPNPKNIRIQAILQECGFNQIGSINTPDGEAILFKLLKTKIHK